MSLSHPTDLPPVVTAADLAARWRLIGADLAPSSTTLADLWVQVLDADGRQQPPFVVVEDVPVHPDRPFVDNLAGVLAHLLGEETAGIGLVAFALVRSAPTEVHAADLSWAGELTAACVREGVRVLGVHLLVGDELTRVS
jgi:hypothetical protein